ncbi:histidine kinase [Streptomyces sp. SCA3-4]|uniref:sensor histidine kinase n=1 Tax=Streptomyces sichuanensis TaxID=2871810 RepID=UPI001CE31E51|nr:histidine kinase [Streptomyces sichuanensis]MCA6095157.1 histidine kinase [Streptomyces sichuanensis]
MPLLIRPLSGADTCKAWLHALTGAGLGVPPFAGALLVVAATPPGWPAPVRTGVLLTVWVILCAAAGALPHARSASVRLANRLLGTALPLPLPLSGAPAKGRRADRLRTAAWLVLHVLAGSAATVVTAFLLMAAVALPAVWCGGGERITLLVSVGVAGGARGMWTLPAAAGLLALACGTAAGTAALLRLPAPALLGHRPAERLAALEAQMRRQAQRNRLARELHDSIGHTLTASTIQAAVAKELMDSDPAAARRALTGLEEASRAAMDDLDHVLGILREDRSPTSPPFSLTDLPALVERVRGTGTDVRADVTGDLAGVPATVSREAYRIVQEGLTNALRHGARSPVDLRVAVTPVRLAIDIANPLAPSAVLRDRLRPRRGRAGRGQGLGQEQEQEHGLGVNGIAERVHLLRGEVSAGPSADGTGWLLTARIPLRSSP